MFVVWGLPYGVGGIYDFLQGQEFLPINVPTLSSIIPDYVPLIWFLIGVIAFIVVTFEGAYRIVQRERNQYQPDNDIVASFARLMREGDGLRIIKANDRMDDLKSILEETVTWAIKAIAEISKRKGAVADQNIRIKAELPLDGELHYSDFTAPFSHEHHENELSIVRRRHYDISYWLRDFIESASLAPDRAKHQQ